jgi:hypothetical protein
VAQEVLATRIEECADPDVTWHRDEDLDLWFQLHKA